MALSVNLPYFAAEMKKKLLYIMPVLLLVAGNIMAQQQLYICRAGQADAYEVNGMAQLELKADSFRIRQQPAYAIEEVDSIVFHSPLLPVRELGWWGNMTNGQSLYKAQLKLVDIYPELDGHDLGILELFEFDVLFIIEAQAGICQTARCEIRFIEEWMIEKLRDIEEWSIANGPDGGPYIYVKETATGPRRFETWVTNSPVLPDGCIWEEDGTLLWSDCSELLSGRPMEDVQVIIEAWVHQTPKRIERTNNNN